MADTIRSSQSGPVPDAEWLVNQIAHTLRNPIFAAMVQSEALMMRAGDLEGISGAVQLVHRQLKRLEADINEMLLYGRPAKLNRRQVDVVRIVEQVAQSFRQGEQGETADVTVSAENGSLVAELDPDAVKIILERLLANAVDHTPSPHEVRVGITSDDDGAVWLEVHDQGEGIPDAIREKIFLPFFPQHSGRPGLGLTVAAKFAEALGGYIELESREGHGTVVRCSLPSPGVDP